MTRLMLITAFLFPCVVQAESIANFEAQTDSQTPAAWLYPSTQLTESWGVSAFVLATDGWAQAYAGPTFTTGGATFGVAAGFQQSPEGLRERFAASLIWAAGPITTVAFFEDDLDNNWWYNLRSTYAIGNVGLGLHGRRFVGSGCTAHYMLGSYQIWGSWMPWDPELSVEAAWDRGLVGVTAFWE